jgi:hypothetical protein
MFNIDLPYKSATPIKSDNCTKAGFKIYLLLYSTFRGSGGKKKLLHPPSCTLDAVKVLKHHS